MDTELLSLRNLYLLELFNVKKIRIFLTYASINGLLVFGVDIQNAYPQAPTSEKYFIICGPEFGL